MCDHFEKGRCNRESASDHIVAGGGVGFTNDQAPPPKYTNFSAKQSRQKMVVSQFGTRMRSAEVYSDRRDINVEAFAFARASLNFWSCMDSMRSQMFKSPTMTDQYAKNRTHFGSWVAINCYILSQITALSLHCYCTHSGLPPPLSGQSEERPLAASASRLEQLVRHPNSRRRP